MLAWLTETFIGKCVSTMLMSMVPVIELRGALPLGVGMGLPIWVSFICSVIGNMIPVPFIIVFIERIFEWLKKSEKIRTVIEKLEKKAHLKGRMVEKYSLIGLFILVAIPLPGTGAWTGSLIAALLDIKMKKAFWPIFFGVVVAGVIVALMTAGVVTIVGCA